MQGGGEKGRKHAWDPLTLIAASVTQQAPRFVHGLDLGISVLCQSFHFAYDVEIFLSTWSLEPPSLRGSGWGHEAPSSPA